jgi:hypothetical protein
VENRSLPATKHIKSEPEAQSVLPLAVKDTAGVVRFPNIRLKQNEQTDNLNRLALIWDNLTFAPGKGKYTPLHLNLKHVLDYQSQLSACWTT